MRRPDRLGDDLERLGVAGDEHVDAERRELGNAGRGERAQRRGRRRAARGEVAEHGDGEGAEHLDGEREPRVPVYFCAGKRKKKRKR